MERRARRGSWARVFILVPAGMLLASCSRFKSVIPSDDPAPAAKAEIRGYLPNTQEGEIWFTQVPMEGMRIHGELRGLLPDQDYAIHIHEGGSCRRPDASGMHFDPAGSGRHGEPGVDPGAHHAGDLPNVHTDAGGAARIDFTTDALGVGVSDFSVVGRTIVLHSEPDDYRSQPSGTAGAKIACGVIEATRGG